jgi:phage terminase large subunit GpA-like protein
MSRGFPIREWHKRPGARNEPLDCRVYAYAALLSSNPNWKRLAANHAARVAAQEEAKKIEEEETPAPQPRVIQPQFAPARTGFVNRWRY